MDDRIQKDGTIKKDQRPTRRKKPLTLWERIARIFKDASEEGKKVNRNNVYARHGIGTGNPMYTSRRGKLKGYMRDKAYQNKRR